MPALKLARGEYVAFLDAEDCWQPNMLEQAASALDAEPDCVLAYSNCEPVDWTGRPLNTTMIGADQAHAPSLDELLHHLWPIMPSAVLMRRSVLQDCRGFSKLFRGYGFEDVHCWLLARERGGFVYLPSRSSGGERRRFQSCAESSVTTPRRPGSSRAWCRNATAFRRRS